MIVIIIILLLRRRRKAMSDFYQTGVVATLHKLGATDLNRMEAELVTYTEERPIALILPCLYSELAGEALEGIVNQLKGARYVAQIVVTLGPASSREFGHVKEFFSVLPQQVSVIWNDGPELTRIYEMIERSGIPMSPPGKGRSVWMAFGYVLSQRHIASIVVHDCDIVTYSREMLARLCYPVTNPTLDYDFCKGFYSRVTDRLHGRVARLLVTPVLRALQTIIGLHPLLLFLDSFRYPLSGEFSMDVGLARVNQIPGDWGLEVGMLAEVYRNTAIRRVCQVDIADSYEHKHQGLFPDDPSQGLHKMCIDICKCLFRTLASQGIIFSAGFLRTLVATYVRTCQDMLKRYEHDAAINGLTFDRHEEALAVDTFTKGIREAAERIMEDPLGAPQIAGWDRVTAAVPGVLDLTRRAVEESNAG